MTKKREKGDSTRRSSAAYKVSKRPLIQPARCDAHDYCGDDFLEFLLITDQKDSSKNPHNEVADRTARHFNEFIPALKVADVVDVVKNIGDSLMIHVRIKKTNLVSFLKRILDAQNALSVGHARPNGHEAAVKIRIVAVYLDPKEHLLGQDINWAPVGKVQAEIPRERLASCPHWLCGDLFGSSVALAFRASGIPKDDIFVVDDRLLKLSEGIGRKDEYFHVEAKDGELHFGPMLAFSPFKGLEDIYIFGGKGPVEESQWEGHLFLRMVAKTKDALKLGPKNPLALDQQKVRVFTDVVWIGKAPDLETSKLRTEIEKKQQRDGFSSAAYIRRYARISMFKEFPLGTPSHKAGVVLIGAYPNPEAYRIIREELGELKDKQEVNYAYPVTNEVYPSESEMKTSFWNPGELTPSFLLIFSRWSEPDRLNPASTAKSRLDNAILEVGLQDRLKVIRCGLIQGGLWDVYATINISQGAAPAIDEGTMSRFCEQLQKECFASATVRLCEEIPPEDDNK